MQDGFVLFSLVCLIVVVSYRGFYNEAFREKFIFDPFYIFSQKQYFRLISSSFLHADWMHLIFNVFSLYALGQGLEVEYGPFTILTIYFSSVMGGSLFSLFMHRNHDYTALGASGGCFGVLFANLLHNPHSSIYMLFFPMAVPIWIFCIVVLIMTVIAIRKNMDYIGHDAHFGGAFTGLVVMGFLHPDLAMESLDIFILCTAIFLMFFYYCWVNPLFLPLRHFFNLNNLRKKKQQKAVDKISVERKELDELLFKISLEGEDSLSKRQKTRLNMLREKYKHL